MSRAARLLSLMELLRQHKYTVSGSELAQTLGVSLRTLYRDIATLQGQGAQIEGEAGVGYVLRPGFTLPPLMFSHDEVQALVLGARWVAQRAGQANAENVADEELAQAAKNVLAKISAVLPAPMRHAMESSGLMVGPTSSVASAPNPLMPWIRKAMRQEIKLRFRYRDDQEQETERVVWPIALGYFERVAILVAWCELRQSYRHFRTDRISDAALLEQAFPRPRAVLVAEWRAQQGVDEQ